MMDAPSLLAPIWLTLSLASVTTVILLLIGLPVAWWISASQSRLRPVAETLIALPLVLPPTVIGFYLLIALNPDSLIGGAFLSLTGHTLVFSFSGLVVASVIYSLPFMVQPMVASFSAIPRPILEAASALNAGPLDRFWHIALPMARAGIIRAGLLTFAHTIGEFGIVLMIGGNIPGETQTIAVALYERVELLDYATAHLWAGGLLLGSILLLLPVYWLGGAPVLPADRRV